MGVKLGHYLDHHPDTDVLVHCLGCMHYTVYPMARVCERLRTRGFKPETYDITAIGKLIKAPCEKCGVVNYQSSPFQNYRPPGGHTAGANRP